MLPYTELCEGWVRCLFNAKRFSLTKSFQEIVFSFLFHWKKTRTVIHVCSWNKLSSFYFKCILTWYKLHIYGGPCQYNQGLSLTQSDIFSASFLLSCRFFRVGERLWQLLQQRFGSTVIAFRIVYYLSMHFLQFRSQTHLQSQRNNKIIFISSAIYSRAENIAFKTYLNHFKNKIASKKSVNACF